MRISQLYRQQQPLFSFEFFPPKTDAGMTSLFNTVRALQDLQPGFVSVTYGAMGSTRAKTIDLVRRFKHELGMEAMAHLTCVGATTEEISEVIAEIRASAIENILALRGDPPQGQETFVTTAGGFAYATELVAHIKATSDFCIGGACYPEGHLEAPSKEADLLHCRQKVEAGAEFLITQLFFDNRDYFDFVRHARAAGIEVPIVPGIMPITNFAQIQRFTTMCGATIPAQVVQDLTPIQDDAGQVEAYGIAYATQQCRALLAAGAPGIHFYTLNKSRATATILAHIRQE